MTSPPLPRLTPRSAQSHKGDFGRALLVGGSRGMAGAIALAGKAALRGGAGLVTLAVSEACLETVAGFEPSYMTLPLRCDDMGRISPAAQSAIEEAAENATCVACGPGQGQSPDLNDLVGSIYRGLQQPAVLDADALNALAAGTADLSDHAGPRVLTPHPGEFRRLANSSATARGEMEAVAKQLAAESGAVIVLKGHQTLVTDGRQSIRNPTGNPGMATGGSGDVLTGVITAFICQGLSPLEAAQLGVYVHGLAGDLAVEQLGEVSMIASDLIDYLSPAIQQAQLPDGGI